MHRLFYSVTDLLDHYLYTKTTKKMGRKVYTGLKIRDLGNWTVKKVYQGDISLEVGGEEIRFSLSNLEEFSILRVGFLGDKDVIKDIADNTSENDVFYDIGANIGIYTCAVGKLSGCKTIAFEPQPQNAEKLGINAEMNDLEPEIHEIAASDIDGEERIDVDKNVPGEGQIGLTDDEKGLKISSRKIDSLVREEMPEPDVVKIDVEGGEIKVLRGMEETFEENPPRLIYCELHPTVTDYGGSKQEVREILEENSYSVDTFERMAAGREMIKAELGNQ